VPRDRFSTPFPVRRWTDQIITAIEQAKESGFHEWNDLEISNEIVSGREYLILHGTVQCIGGIRVQAFERIRFNRETRWSPEGDNRLVRVIEYSYSAVLNKEGNIFRYDSPDVVQNEKTGEHHRYHHKHSFDVLGSGSQIGESARIPVHEVPNLRQVLQEAERWHYTQPNRS
jgi:hypothetical protein